MNENLEVIEGIEVVENEIIPTETTEEEFEVEEGGSGKLLLAGGLLASAIVGGAVVAYKKIKAKNGKTKTKKKLMFVEVDEDGNIIQKNSKEDSDNESED